MLQSSELEHFTAQKIKMLKNNDFSFLQTLRCCIYQANKCQRVILTFMTMIKSFITSGQFSSPVTYCDMFWYILGTFEE